MLPGFSPTRMTARPGVNPCCSLRRAISATVSALICSAMALPSMSFADIALRLPYHVDAFDGNDGVAVTFAPALCANNANVFALKFLQFHIGSRLQISDAKAELVRLFSPQLEGCRRV